MAGQAEQDPQGGDSGTVKPNEGQAQGRLGLQGVWAGHPLIQPASSAGSSGQGGAGSGDQGRGGRGGSDTGGEGARGPEAGAATISGLGRAYYDARARLTTTFAQLLDGLMKLGSLVLTPSFLVIVFLILSMIFVYSVAGDSSRLSSVEYARGLITLLFSVGTLVIAVLLTISVLFPPQDSKVADERFNRGKDVLTILIGIFGTILGFYFGSLKTQADREKALASIEQRGGEISGSTVYLDRSTVTNDDLIVLRRLPFVERLFLDTSSITDDGLKYLRDLTNLKFVSLRGTKVHKEPVQDLQKALGKSFQTVPPPEELPSLEPAAAPATPIPESPKPNMGAPIKNEVTGGPAPPPGK